MSRIEVRQARRDLDARFFIFFEVLVVLFDFVDLIVEVLYNRSDVYEKPERKILYDTLTASKLIRESTALEAALLSAWFASRRNRVLETYH